LYRIQNHKSDVKTVPITQSTLIEAIYGIGTLSAKHSYQLKVAVPTPVNQLPVKEGEFIKKGQLLMQGEVPFYAPFDGTITQVSVKPGEIVAPQTVILTLTDLKNCEVVVALDQEAVFGVKPGQKARLSFEGLRQKSVEGRVRSVYSSEQQFWVIVDLIQLPADALPGMTVDVAIQIAEHPKAWQVPVSAIQSKGLKILRQKKTLFVPIETGVISGDKAQVVSGDIRPGDRVILPE
jgi:Cu(I)/Ag(I) efflux system membrane fusion protein